MKVVQKQHQRMLLGRHHLQYVAHHAVLAPLGLHRPEHGQRRLRAQDQLKDRTELEQHLSQVPQRLLERLRPLHQPLRRIRQQAAGQGLECLRQAAERNVAP